MLAYAANAPRFADRRKSPKALLLIVGAHAAALSAVMMVKMDVQIVRDPPIKIIDIFDPPPPKPVATTPPPEPRSSPQRPISTIDTVKPIIPIDKIGPVVAETPIQQPPIGPIPGVGTDYVPPLPIHPPVRVAARFNTPEWALKPPYPLEKRNAEQEATLKLRLSIDDRGRVIAVEPLGAVDPVFLSAARKHLIAKWRYRPATEDGRPVHSSTVVTLRFELEA
jgi:protein TonB